MSFAPFTDPCGLLTGILELIAGEIHLAGNGKRAAHLGVHLLEGDDVAPAVVQPVGVDAPQNRSPFHEIAVVGGERIDGPRLRIEVGAGEGCRIGQV
jgi:hypothetical protein